jgi:hypothetical protein
MRWLVGGALVAFINIGMLSPSFAVVCGPATGVNLEIGGAAAAASCFSNGTGANILNGGSDPLLSLPGTPWSLLDTPTTGGPNPDGLALNFSNTPLNTDGSFSVTLPSGYAAFALGFQFAVSRFLNVTPDWFILTGLPTSGTGTFDGDFVINHFTVFFSDPIKYATLYGIACGEDHPCASPLSTTPLPAAVWLFGSVLAGGAGFGRWRRRKANSATLVPA